MSSGFRQILAVLASLLFAISMPAQDIPVLPDDPSILKGVTPDGLSYYLVSNKAVPGAADFALVQRNGSITDAREALSYLPRVKSQSPQDFLLRHGSAPGRSGYVKASDDAVVFRMENITFESGKAVLDSTLLMIMDIVDGYYAPADQAVVISGDIDAKAVAEKLTSMSYMIPYVEPSPLLQFGSEMNEEALFVTDSDDSPFADISFTWKSQRLPREYMNTVQPAIFEKAVTVLGRVAVAEVRKMLEQKGIPAAEVGYDHVCSDETPYDDSFTLNLTVRRQDAAEAFEVATEVMASLDSDGAGIDEYMVAEAQALEMMEAAVDKGNAGYVDRCINAFLNNSSLASPETVLDFQTSRKMTPSTRQALFNDIAMALLDSAANLTVKCPGDSLSVREAFDSVWRASAASGVLPSEMNMADTLSFPGKQAKVKIKSVKKEHVSGGSIWLFSNGIKVIYKKMASDRMYYTLALSRGYSGISGLEPGEGAFMSDYLRTCRIAGLKGSTFMDILKREGIGMDVNVSMSNTMISGEAPEERMHLLLRSLLAVVNERKGNDEAFRYYKESENLRLEHAGEDFVRRMAVIDSLMCPDYRYSSYKTAGNISSGFQEKAEAFFNEVFAKTGDGALVLVGNMDEEKLKKILLEYVGGFRTTDTAFRRPVVRYHPVSGWSTYTVDGDVNSIEVAVSARMPISAENYIAAHLSAEVLERRLVAELGNSGMHAEVSYNCRMYPEERLNVYITVSEASHDGFKAGMEAKTPIEVLGMVRSVLMDLHCMEVSEDVLKICKAQLKSEIATEMQDPRYWVDAIVLRYLDGKDLSTGYASKVDAVTPVKVQSVLKMLDDGSKIEYVTTRKY
jgi:hypothetical protein